MELPEEVLEKLGDAVRAGEHQPVVRVELQQRVHDVLPAGGGLEGDGGHLQHFGAQFTQLTGKLRGLLARAGDDQSPSKQ